MTKPASVTPLSLAICMPIGEEAVHPLTIRSLLAMRAAMPKDLPVHFLDTVEVGVENARNFLTQRALDLSVSHLLWIDSDMVFDPDAANRLLDHDLPIVGGLCHNRRHPYMPILIRKMTHGEHKGAYSFMYDYPLGLVDVDATGAAFLLVKRTVFEEIGKQLEGKPGDPGWFTNDNAGEDISFCQRAVSAGFYVVVDTTLEIGHVGEVVVDSKFARRNREIVVNQWKPW